MDSPIISGLVQGACYNLSMIKQGKRLADLHLHLLGSIHPWDCLEFIKQQAVDWESYERDFQEAYGQVPAIRAILKRCNAGSPGALEEFKKLFVFSDQDAGNFARFQAKYNLLVSGIGWTKSLLPDSQFPKYVTEICGFAHRIIARQRRQNIGYAEQRMTLNPRLTKAQAKYLLEALLKAYSEYSDSDIQPRLAVSLPRDDPWPGWEVTTELALGPYGHLLTGVDFCYLEEGHPPKDQRQFFSEASAFNRRHPERALAVLYHVGESFEDKSLESAIRWVHEAAEMGAHRLGHAIALGVNPDKYGVHSRLEPVSERIAQLEYDLLHAAGLRDSGVTIEVELINRELQQLAGLPKSHQLNVGYDQRRLEELRARQSYAIHRIRDLGSVIEVCPTSNRRIGGISQDDHHPLIQFVTNDAPFVVATDDPGIFDTTLAEEIEASVAIAGLESEAYDEIAQRSWRHRSEVLVGRVKS